MLTRMKALARRPCRAGGWAGNMPASATGAGSVSGRTGGVAAYRSTPMVTLNPSHGSRPLVDVEGATGVRRERGIERREPIFPPHN